MKMRTAPRTNGLFVMMLSSIPFIALRPVRRKRLHASRRPILPKSWNLGTDISARSEHAECRAFSARSPLSVCCNPPAAQRFRCSRRALGAIHQHRARPDPDLRLAGSAPSTRASPALQVATVIGQFATLSAWASCFNQLRRIPKSSSQLQRVSAPAAPSSARSIPLACRPSSWPPSLP